MPLTRPARIGWPASTLRGGSCDGPCRSWNRSVFLFTPAWFASSPRLRPAGLVTARSAVTQSTSCTIVQGQAEILRFSETAASSRLSSGARESGNGLGASVGVGFATPIQGDSAARRRRATSAACSRRRPVRRITELACARALSRVRRRSVRRRRPRRSPGPVSGSWRRGWPC